MKKRMLCVPQLSNYDRYGRFLLSCDSAFQIWSARPREMLRLNENLEIDLLLPRLSGPNKQVDAHPRDFFPEMFESGRLHILETDLIANAPATRYDFDMKSLAGLLSGRHYDAVFLNDPCLLPNYKAMFYLFHGHTPRFYTEASFIDHPASSGNEKFPREVSMWLRQLEGMLRSDGNFWMCQTTADVVIEDARKTYQEPLIQELLSHSQVWDNGYSQFEASRPWDLSKMRFTEAEFANKTAGKTVIFVPNRVGGRGRTSDYTHVGEFLFERLPELRRLRQDYVVIAGNPNQKFSNKELQDECGPNGLINLVPDAFNRDEYRFVANHADIAVSLYDTEHHGGCAARECVEMGCLPLWPDCNEYTHMAAPSQYTVGLCKADRSDLVERLDHLIHFVRNDPALAMNRARALREAVRNRCAYERTTTAAMTIMDLL